MLFWNESKKILFQPVVIGFVIFCILLNGTFILLTYNDYQFDRNINSVNIFTDFQADNIAQDYIQKYDVTGKKADNIIKKYEKVQKVIDQKAENGDALSFYFGTQTPYVHSTLFGLIFMLIIAEVCLIGLFLGIFSTTFEKINGTESVVYASNIGRKIIWKKLNAVWIGTLLTSVVVVGMSLTIFFLQFDFSGVWFDYVSSGFNYAVGEFGKPFITWNRLTVVQYLWATIALTIGLAICFALIGFTAGIFVRNSYTTFLISVIILGGLFVVKYLFPIGSTVRAMLGMTPVWLWKTSHEWFTDGGADIIWKYYETIGLSASFLGLSLLILIGTKVFAKKEIV
ncbi:hypothetical protein ACLIBG_00565 [Virgibacillus sp. W0181]|jgi:hypothetical protein|uniref:hypothetical protein n=1 Tax=Virgibacillus sp. W0181 TaxID=3391581 RepID=UPI003F4755E7